MLEFLFGSFSLAYSIGLYVLLAVICILIWQFAMIVPEKTVYVVERLGKFNKICEAGLNFKIPVLDKVAYRLNFKEEVHDIQPQVCITRDNVQVKVDGILYFRVVDAVKAAYGINNYRLAISQLAQTTMRSEIGKLELDKTFSGREALNASIISALEDASAGWGIKVNRYEIMDITPSETILEAMESQMRAEREKRADVLLSEGKKQSRVNRSMGEKEKAINESKGEKEKRIMIAEGISKAIQLKGYATSQALMLIAQALKEEKGMDAKKLHLIQSYIHTVEGVLKKGKVSVYPSSIASIASITDVIKKVGEKC